MEIHAEPGPKGSNFHLHVALRPSERIFINLELHLSGVSTVKSIKVIEIIFLIVSRPLS